MGRIIGCDDGQRPHGERARVSRVNCRAKVEAPVSSVCAMHNN